MDESVVVSLGWLADRLDEPSVRPVDVRDPWAFEGIGHVPGAVTVPFDRFRDGGDDAPGMLPGPDAFAALLAESGAAGAEPSGAGGAAPTLVAYDDTFGVFAARFLLTALVYGYEDVRLLAGDYSAWSRQYGTTTEVPEPPTETGDPLALEPLAPSESPLIDRDGVAAVLEAGDPDTVLVDTRERDEFEAARLPGAVRFDWREVVDEDARRLKPREAAERALAERGITRDRRIVLYCNTGRRISHTYVVLRWLGFEDVAFYEGSLEEWLAADGDVASGPAGADADRDAVPDDAEPGPGVEE